MAATIRCFQSGWELSELWLGAAVPSYLQLTVSVVNHIIPGDSLTGSRYNGLRDDVASFLADIKPSFLRFPGGNNLWVLLMEDVSAPEAELIVPQGRRNPKRSLEVE